MTPQQAEAYSKQVLAAITREWAGVLDSGSHHYRDAVDREQIYSALRALRRAEEGLEDALNCDCECYRQENHARRWAEARDDAHVDLRRLGQLYGISQ
jgi:hypothetical protein